MVITKQGWSLTAFTKARLALVCELLDLQVAA